MQGRAGVGGGGVGRGAPADPEPEPETARRLALRGWHSSTQWTKIGLRRDRALGSLVADTVTIRQAKTHLSQLADRAHRGEEIVIAKGKVPWARLVPLEQPAARQPGLLAGSVGDAFFEPLRDDVLALAGAWKDDDFVVPDCSSQGLQ